MSDVKRRVVTVRVCVFVWVSVSVCVFRFEHALNFLFFFSKMPTDVSCGDQKNFKEVSISLTAIFHDVSVFVMIRLLNHSGPVDEQIDGKTLSVSRHQGVKSCCRVFYGCVATSHICLQSLWTFFLLNCDLFLFSLVIFSCSLFYLLGPVALSVFLIQVMWSD